MKFICIIGSLSIIVLIVLSAGCITAQTNKPDNLIPVTVTGIRDTSSLQQYQSAAIQGSISHSMSFFVPTKGIPTKVLVYKTLSPNVTRSRVEELAQIFHVKGTIGEGTHGMGVHTEDFVYSVALEKPAGTIIYTVVGRPDDVLDSQDKLPTDEEAIRIATQFLQANNLYPDGAYFRTTDRHYERSADENGNEILHAGQIEILFGRKLNNLDVWGTRLSVNIGGNGDIIGYYANCREYVPFREVTIKSPEAAFEDLKQAGIKTKMNNASISITDVSLAYRTKAGAYEEEYLEPIWVFSGEASADKEGTYPVSKFIPALTDDTVKSLSSS
jgi:hypothetical protein